MTFTSLTHEGEHRLRDEVEVEVEVEDHAELDRNTAEHAEYGASFRGPYNAANWPDAAEPMATERKNSATICVPKRKPIVDCNSPVTSGPKNAPRLALC